MDKRIDQLGVLGAFANTDEFADLPDGAPEPLRGNIGQLADFLTKGPSGAVQFSDANTQNGVSEFSYDKTVATGGLSIGNTTASTNTTTGALTVVGGGGFGGSVFATDFNGVSLTISGSATDFLNAEGSYVAAGGGGTPGGADTQVQFNNVGAFGGATTVRIVSGVFFLGAAGSDPTGSKRMGISYGASMRGIRLQPTSNTSNNAILTDPAISGFSGSLIRADVGAAANTAHDLFTATSVGAHIRTRNVSSANIAFEYLRAYTQWTGVNGYNAVVAGADQVRLYGDFTSKNLLLSENTGAYHAVARNSEQTYTPSNVTTTRAFDADSTTLAEIADVLGTLIADQKTAKTIL